MKAKRDHLLNQIAEIAEQVGSNGPSDEQSDDLIQLALDLGFVILSARRVAETGEMSEEVEQAISVHGVDDGDPPFDGGVPLREEWKKAVNRLHARDIIPKAPIDESIVTDDLIRAVMSDRGGFSKKSLEWLGVPYPPKSGWKERILGKPRVPVRPGLIVTLTDRR
jgi:hypothetical protein